MHYVAQSPKIEQNSGMIFVLELNFDVHIFDHASYISELLVVTMVIDWEPWPANHNYYSR